MGDQAVPGADEQELRLQRQRGRSRRRVRRIGGTVLPGGTTIETTSTQCPTTELTVTDLQKLKFMFNLIIHC